MLINQNLIPFFSQPACSLCRQAGGRQVSTTTVLGFLTGLSLPIEYPQPYSSHQLHFPQRQAGKIRHLFTFSLYFF